MGSRIDRELVGELLAARDEAGYLSIYASLDDPGRCEIELKRELEAAGLVPARGAHPSRLQQVAADAMRTVRERAQVPGQAARGLVGFLPIEGDAGDQVWLEVGEALPNAVVVGAAPYLAPLLDMWEALRPTGVVVAGHRTLTTYEWDGLGLEPIDHFDVEVDTSQWRRYEGPGRSSFSGGPSSHLNHDAFAQRLSRRQLTELDAAAGLALALRPAQRGWERIIWFGARDVVDLLQPRVPQNVRQVVGSDEELVNVTRGRIVESVRAAVRRDLHEREHQLIEMVRETVPSRIARGIAEIEELAQQGRVDLLLLDHEAHDDVEGRRSIEHLIRSVYDQGGEVFAFHDESLLDAADVNAVARLRY
ncbi:MAG: hypothetical protein JWO69_300 [Thermoleophilia bacterium]|nr:hypothetical protein [Thermoleophilia bacterium]